MYGLEELRKLPLELRSRTDRILDTLPTEDELDAAFASAGSQRSILEGLLRTGNEEERLLAGRALASLAGFEEALRYCRRLLCEKAAGQEIDRLNIDVFRRYIDHENRALRIMAVLKAAEMDFEATLPLMKERLGVEDDPHVVSALVKAVAIIGRRWERRLVSEYLSHPDARVRANAVEGLACNRSPRNFSLLLAAMDDSNHRVRLNAALGLSDEYPGMLDELMSELAVSDVVEARRAVLWAASEHYGTQDGEHFLLDALSDPDVSVASRALELLGHRDDPGFAEILVRTYEELQERLEEDDPDGSRWNDLLRKRLLALSHSAEPQTRSIVEPCIARLSSPSSVSTGGERSGGGSVPGEGVGLEAAPSERRPGPQKTVWIRLAGRVVEGVRKEPVPQVTLRLSNTGFQEVSDRRGRFCFERIEANKVHVFVCEKQGWPTTTFRYRASGQREQRVIIRMRPRGNVRGRRK